MMYMRFFCVDHNTKYVHSENQNEFSMWEEYTDSESVNLIAVRKPVINLKPIRTDLC